MEDADSLLSRFKTLNTKDNAMSVFSPISNVSVTEGRDASENGSSSNKQNASNHLISEQNHRYDSSIDKSMRLFSPLETNGSSPLEIQRSAPPDIHSPSVSLKLDFSPYGIQNKKRNYSVETDSEFLRTGFQAQQNNSASTSSTSFINNSAFISTKPSRASGNHWNRTQQNSWENHGIMQNDIRNLTPHDESNKKNTIFDPKYNADFAGDEDSKLLDNDKFGGFSQSPDIKSSSKNTNNKVLRASKDFPWKTSRKTEKTFGLNSLLDSGPTFHFQPPTSGLDPGVGSDSSAIGQTSTSASKSLFVFDKTTPDLMTSHNSGSEPGVKVFRRIKLENLEDPKDIGTGVRYINPTTVKNNDNNGSNYKGDIKDDTNKLSEEMAEMTECIKGNVNDLHVDFLKFLHQNQLFQMQQMENLNRICDRIESLEEKFLRLESEIKMFKNTY